MTAELLPAVLAGAVRTFRGEPNADTTLALMQRVVDQEYENPGLVEVAVTIAESAPEKNDRAQANALMRWLRAHTRFVADPVNQQLLKVPTYMLALIRRDGMAGGDCVDIAMLSAALALAVGMTVKFVAEGYEAAGKVHADLVHVYAIVQTAAGDPGEWVNLDTQRTVAEPDTHPVVRVEVDVPQ